MFLLFYATAVADPPAPPEGCFDSVLIDPEGIGKAPTCWFVNGDGVYQSPAIVDIRIQALGDGRIQARREAEVTNTHGHAVHWDTTNACATDADVLCQIGIGGGASVGTTNWRIVVTPTGRATLTCTYEP